MMKRLILLLLSLAVFSSCSLAKIDEKVPVTIDEKHQIETDEKLFETQKIEIDEEIHVNEADISLPSEDIYEDMSYSELFDWIESEEEHIDGSIYGDVEFSFEPSNYYGKLLPYVGHYSEIPGSKRNYEQGFLKYGLCTENGTVVVDALDHVISDVRILETNDGFIFYVIGVGKVKDSSYDGYHPQKTFLLPQNGQWATELEEGNWAFICGDGAIFAARAKDETVKGITYEYFDKVILLNYNGLIVKEYGKCSYLRGFDDHFEHCLEMKIADETYQNYYNLYIGPDGGEIENPIIKGHEFNEYGVRLAGDKNGYFLENTKGQMLTETTFRYFRYVSNKDGTNGLFVAKMQATNDLYQYFFFSEDGCSVSSGNEVYSKHDIELFFPDSGDIICMYIADDGVIDDVTVFLNLTDNKIVYEDHSGRSVYHKSTDKMIIQRAATYGGGFGRILDYTGRELAYFDDFYEFDDIADNGKFVIYTSCANYYDIFNDDYSLERDERKTYIYDIENKKILHSLHGNNAIDFIGENDRYVYMFNYSEIEGGGAFNYCLYDTLKEKLIVENAEKIVRFDIGDEIYFAVCYKNNATLYDGEMNVIYTSYFE